MIGTYNRRLKIWSKNSQPFVKECQKTSDRDFLTHTVENLVKKAAGSSTALYLKHVRSLIMAYNAMNVFKCFNHLRNKLLYFYLLELTRTPSWCKGKRAADSSACMNAPSANSVLFSRYWRIKLENSSFSPLHPCLTPPRGGQLEFLGETYPAKLEGYGYCIVTRKFSKADKPAR